MRLHVFSNLFLQLTTAAQVRAALGLQSQLDQATALLQAHAQRQQQSVDLMQMRQMLLQPSDHHVNNQVRDLQLLAVGEQLEDFPDLQQHYRTLLLSDQMQREHQVQAQAQVAQAQLRYEEGLRRQLLSHETITRRALAEQAMMSPTVVAAESMNRQGVGSTPPSVVDLTMTDDSSRLQHAQLLLGAVGAHDAPSTGDSKPHALSGDSMVTSETSNGDEETSNNNHDATVTAQHVINTFAEAAQVASKANMRLTVEDLIHASEFADNVNKASEALETLMKSAEETPIFDQHSEPGQVVTTQSDLTTTLRSTYPLKRANYVDVIIDAMREQPAAKRQRMVSAVSEIPVSGDAWWPTYNGIKRERREAGETSDEEDFEDDPSGPQGKFRANRATIDSRMASLPEPGVLEKLPHCVLHRVRYHKDKSKTPEFVYCFQVTDLYPNDAMVCCSICGTWRHAACGGHHKGFQKEKGTCKVVCDRCHEETPYVTKTPLGENRIELQRIEHNRNMLASSAIMRHAALAKHGGAYKWPLGSVSAAYMSGHIRSVQSRHDKAEKQWFDMSQRLGRGVGYRHKDRVKSRTKELERLMVCIEDAEAYTERHNMIHFLTRDTTQRDVPVGYERELFNFFDPDEPQTNDEESGSDESNSRVCLRAECSKLRRFDSLFCSDACGVAVMEKDLLHSLLDAKAMNPLALRP